MKSDWIHGLAGGVHCILITCKVVVMRSLHAYSSLPFPAYAMRSNTGFMTSLGSQVIEDITIAPGFRQDNGSL